MSALTEQVAREHGTYSGIACWCGYYPPDDVPLHADRTRHLIEVTEEAVRANVAAEIRAAIFAPENTKTGTIYGCGLDRAARIAEGKHP